MIFFVIMRVKERQAIVIGITDSDFVYNEISERGKSFSQKLRLHRKDG